MAHIADLCIGCELPWQIFHGCSNREPLRNRVTLYTRTSLVEFLIHYYGDIPEITKDSILCEKCLQAANLKDGQNIGKIKEKKSMKKHLNSKRSHRNTYKNKIENIKKANDMVVPKNDDKMNIEVLPKEEKGEDEVELNVGEEALNLVSITATDAPGISIHNNDDSSLMTTIKCEPQDDQMIFEDSGESIQTALQKSMETGSSTDETESIGLPDLELNASETECMSCGLTVPPVVGLQYHKCPSSNVISSNFIHNAAESSDSNISIEANYHHTNISDNSTKSVLKMFSSKMTHVCSHCNNSFMSKKKLLFHMAQKHSDISYTCAYCPETFCTTDLLKSHIFISHEEMSSIQCEECPKKFTSAYDFEDHAVAYHKNKLKFKCKVCEKYYATRVMFKKHTIKHMPYSCNICSAAFKKSHSLSNHLKNTHKIYPELSNNNDPTSEASTCKDKPYIKEEAAKQLINVRGLPSDTRVQCVVCSKDVTVGFLRTHMLKHEGNPLYPCKHCEKKFYQSTLLYKHMKRHHPEEPIEFSRGTKTVSIYCPECQWECQSYEKLEEHMCHEHSSKKNISCDLCDLEFTFAKSHAEHMKLHYFKERQKCGHCPKDFISIGCYSEHVSRCAEGWQCDVCHKVLRVEETYRRHLREVHREGVSTLYACHFCDKTFVNKFSYEDHQLSHTQYKQLQCPLCPSKFKRKRPLLAHYASKHPEASSDIVHLIGSTKAQLNSTASIIIVRG